MTVAACTRASPLAPSRPLLTLVAAAALAWVTCGWAADSNLVVAGAWIRQPPPGSDVAAVYLSLQNAGTGAVRLTGVECALAGRVMMHETVHAGGQARMRPFKSVTLAPGQSIAFTPGGRHIMLHGLAHPLQVGERVPVVLEFSGGTRLHVLALVRPLDAG